MTRTKGSLSSQKRTLFVAVVAVFFISFAVSSSYRGMAHDEGIGGFRLGAERIIAHQPILSDVDIEVGNDAPKVPARLIYIILIAIGFKIFGFNLVALHIFPYLLQIINPCLFFIIVFRLYKSIWWGLVGALFFILHPFNVVFLNLQHNTPIFMFFLLIILLLFESAIKKPEMLILCGVVASLLILTRFEGGVMFVTILYGMYIIYRWNTGIPVKWLMLSLGALLITYLMFAFYFGFPVFYHKYYLPQLLQRQALSGSQFSFYGLTMHAFRNFLNWYFCGKLIAPFLCILIVIGTFTQMKKRIFYPIAIFLPYFLFLLFIYNGRYNVGNLPVATLSVPGFLLLLLSGIQVVSSFFSSLLLKVNLKVKRNSLLYLKRFINFLLPQKVIGSIFVVCILGFFCRSAYSLAIVVEDIIPASTMLRIVKYNPPMPGNPLYKEAYVQLNREERFSVELREELFRTVRGNYRSWFLRKIGEYAFDHGTPEQARTDADFSYVDGYRSKDKWEKDRYHFEGTSPLWSDEYPKRIGAFPFGKGGSFVYKFDFPKPIDYVTISDIHMQWGGGDVTKMWTSTDGEHWTLRYNNWNLRYRKDYYYQFFEDEFDGYKSLFIKYYFHAGDKTRTGNDNRGACLEEFSLAVKYKEQ